LPCGERRAPLHPSSRVLGEERRGQITQLTCVHLSQLARQPHCWRSVLRFLDNGLMCRGYIKFGSVYHDDRHIIGTGYQDAYAAERDVTAFKLEADERGTPFVQVDQQLRYLIARDKFAQRVLAAGLSPAELVQD
jgi:hypothetical protein